MVGHQRIFLGHANEDKPKVRKLYHELKARGFSPWLDSEDLLPGQNWQVEIPKAIKSAAIFLACLSKQSVAKRGYVQREFRYALSACAELPPDTIYLIPVRLDDCEIPDLRLPELELKLRDLHWVDLFNEEGFERLLGAIRRNIELEKVPPTLELSPTKSVVQPKPFEIIRDADSPLCPEMILLPAGTFRMGSPKDEADVMISEPFFLGRFAVTFAEYDQFCKQTLRTKPKDEVWGRGRRPVINVSHHAAVAYCDWLSEATGRRYHLPTEAQWEYACRAGTITPFSFGSGITTDQANFHGNYPYADGAKGKYRRRTIPVGSLPANPWGLHEMHGNVWEWCADWADDYTYLYYPPKDSIDPQGITHGSKRVLRGGSWSSSALKLCSAFRGMSKPIDIANNVGFRCAAILES